MIKISHTFISTCLVLTFGFALFYIGTEGFSAYTTEAARVNQLIKEKPVIPNVTLEDSNERSYPISMFEGKYVFITFIYTACGSVCPQIEMNMAKVYDKVPSKYIEKDIIFLSISFDPRRDDPATLNEYKDYFNSDGESWRMARIPDKTELDSLLKEFGVTVISDGKGNFTHNAAFYLVDPNGRLVNVMDYKNIDEAATKVVSFLEKGE